jgi:hypothetical protein
VKRHVVKTLMLALVVLVGGERTAHAAVTPSYDILGWTQDSNFFIYTISDEDPQEWHVISAQTAQEQVFTDKVTFDAFAKPHPLVEDIAKGERSRDGAVVLKKEKSNHQTLKRGSQTLGTESFPKQGNVAYAWSPDSRSIGFLYESTTCNPSGNGDFNCNQDVRVLVDRTIGPRLKVVSKGLKPASLESAARAVAAAGFRITKREAAQAARTQSVVYAVKAQMEAARKLAAVIPGGAEVQPLTWDKNFDLVVALGASADR